MSEIFDELYIRLWCVECATSAYFVSFAMQTVGTGGDWLSDIPLELFTSPRLPLPPA